MSNLKQQLNKSNTQLSDLGLFIKLTNMADPEITSPEDLAKSISEEFGVQCSMEDINNYYSQHIVNEDYELESRRQEYGITMQC